MLSSLISALSKGGSNGLPPEYAKKKDQVKYKDKDMEEQQFAIANEDSDEEHKL